MYVCVSLCSHLYLGSNERKQVRVVPHVSLAFALTVSLPDAY